MLSQTTDTLLYVHTLGLGQYDYFYQKQTGALAEPDISLAVILHD